MAVFKDEIARQKYPGSWWWTRILGFFFFFFNISSFGWREEWWWKVPPRTQLSPDVHRAEVCPSESVLETKLWAELSYLERNRPISQRVIWSQRLLGLLSTVHICSTLRVNIFMRKEQIVSGTVAAYFSDCVFQCKFPNTKERVQHFLSTNTNVLHWNCGRQSPSYHGKFQLVHTSYGLSSWGHWGLRDVAYLVTWRADIRETSAPPIWSTLILTDSLLPSSK
jgi:hypothetical protein